MAYDLLFKTLQGMVNFIYYNITLAVSFGNMEIFFSYTTVIKDV